MDYYFNIATKEPFTGNTVAGDDAVAKGIAVKKTGIADVESWRLSLDDSGNVVVFADGKTEAEAQTQKEEERTAQTAADLALEKELEDARAAE
tara:strand:+ start:31 stop:309 length:279 start_codon:yes stop_codon:yes gene_type:complete